MVNGDDLCKCESMSDDFEGVGESEASRLTAASSAFMGGSGAETPMTESASAVLGSFRELDLVRRRTPVKKIKN